MSEPRILLCGPASNAEESADSLEMLGQVDLPGATKYVVTTGKFDAHKLAKTFNVEADYPTEPARLQTMAGWAEFPDLTRSRCRDGYDLFCLRGILAKEGPFDYAIVLRDARDLEKRWPGLCAQIDGKPYLCFEAGSPAVSEASQGCNVMFNLKEDTAAAVLELAWELYASGNVYAMSPYSLDGALATALEGAGIVLELGGR